MGWAFLGGVVVGAGGMFLALNPALLMTAWRWLKRKAR